MNKKSFFLKAFIGVILVLVGLLLGLGTAERFACEEPSVQVSQIAKSANVMIDTEEDIFTFSDIEIQSNDTVWSVLKRLSESQSEKLQVTSQSYGEMGILISAINGITGGADNKYWQYWVNNEYAQVSADKQLVQPGDVIMWKFTNSKFKEY
ncbi:MAG: DUF4430 domain-containing protein [Candidatus Komeilibacteria bacterium]|nr:DUF4430 domain-containing protein [Candidatus Komeilibacteria bacterium]